MTTVEDRDFIFQMGPRQISAGLFIAVVLIGMCGAIAYVAGRAAWSVPAGSAAMPPAAEVREPAARDEALPPPPPEPAPVSYFRVPSRGELYLQVAAVDRGPAEVFAEYLTRNGFPAQFAGGPDERSYRVLVGPILADSQLATLRAGLESAGFKPFVRKY